jgi:galactokinase
MCYAIQHAHRFEVDTGKVLKAVSGLDNVRAMLMAGVLAHEHIEGLESEIRATAPASDRIVGLDHNSAAYQATVRTVDRLIVIVGTSNVYREREPDDHERRLAELEAGRRLLGSRWLSLHTEGCVAWYNHLSCCQIRRRSYWRSGNCRVERDQDIVGPPLNSKPT